MTVRTEADIMKAEETRAVIMKVKENANISLV
jgi:hypothetical protein